MEESQFNEVRQIIAHASDGNWMPLAIVAGCFTLVILLLVYIYNLHQKTNSEKHNTTERMINEIAKNNLRLDKIVEKHDLRLDHQDEKIKDLKAS